MNNFKYQKHLGLVMFLILCSLSSFVCFNNKYPITYLHIGHVHILYIYIYILYAYPWHNGQVRDTISEYGKCLIIYKHPILV